MSIVLKPLPDFLDWPNLIPLLVWVADKFDTDMELSYLRLKIILRIYLHVQYITYFILVEIVFYWSPYKTYILFPYIKIPRKKQVKDKFYLTSRISPTGDVKVTLVSNANSTRTLFENWTPQKDSLLGCRWFFLSSLTAARKITLYRLKSVT